MRKLIIAGNWKLNAGAEAAATALAKGIADKHGQTDAVDIVFCPPFTSLRAVQSVIKGTKIGLGGQNLYPKADGAYTGEISPLFLLDCGCKYVIIGHSERRTYFKETNEFINEKVKCAFANNLIPILCIGETEQEREAGKTEAVVEDHLRGGLAGLTAEQVKGMVIAYEPVWAIGTGKTATPDDAQSVHAFCRKIISGLFDETTAQTMRIQYGGSVKADNAKELLGQPDIDGALVGGASLKADSFIGIIENSGAL
ncbi:MAG: triose-phosphate isomerase [Candidatus Omnitrophota bacterium]|jgi:triosephosphate isomerase|nr:MAG: triose-phosphate isomerase [Candidatus Omnitrophota bacterium]